MNVLTKLIYQTHLPNSFTKLIYDTFSVHKGGQTVRFFILPFNLNFKPFTQSLQVSLLLPNQLLARRWTPSYFANDQLNEFEYPLADRPLVGLYTIEVTILNQKFRRCFFVIDQHQHQQFHRQNEVELFVSFKSDHLLLSQNRFEGSIVIGRGREDANLENYLIKCSIFLLFKDFVDRQEGTVWVQSVNCVPQKVDPKLILTFQFYSPAILQQVTRKTFLFQ